MTWARPLPRPHSLLLTGGLLWPLVAAAQWTPEVEGLHSFRLWTGETSVQLSVEGRAETRINRGEAVRRDYLFIEPVVGIDLRGSIYHPNLAEFSFRPELGPSWHLLRLGTTGGVQWSQKWLQHYDLRVTLLRARPFATQLFAERGFSYRDLDFFNRARIDSVRFGGNSGHTAGQIPFKVEALHLTETVTGDLGRITEISNNTVTLTASRSPRENHKVNFSYQLNQFTSAEAGLPATAGTAQNVNLLDQLSWGKEPWASLTSSALFSSLGSTAGHTRSATILENFELRLRPNLAAEAHYDFGHQASDHVTSQSHEARGALRHQFYQSIASVVAVQGASLSSRSSSTSLGHERIGLSVEENYTKHLPLYSLLTLSAHWREDWQQRKTSGQTLLVADERVTLRDLEPTFLAQPSVLEVGRLTNPLGLAYRENLDYLVVRHDGLTEIRRLSGGNIPAGSQVLANYSATALPSDRYTTTTHGYSARLDCYHGLVAGYGRLNQVKNVGSQTVVLRNLTEQVAGAEFTWRWIACGAEQARLDSNLSPYRTRRVFESCAFDIGGGSAISLNCEQTWSTFPDTGRTRTGRSAVVRLQHQWTSFLAWRIEAGFRHERGLGIDQDRTTVRTGLTYAYGKLSLNLSYDFDDEALLGELHHRQHGVLRCKRVF